MNKAEEFVGYSLQDRDLAHIAHWKTKSFAEHKALNEFYDELLELIDGFVEQYQGYYKTRMNIERVDGTPTQSIIETIEQSMEWIENNRYEICDKTETPLQNTIDEIVRLYQHTLYMLTLE
jgi:5-methylcytosine-specific restriction endonuclease McrBC regulatory subunit McrC